MAEIDTTRPADGWGVIGGGEIVSRDGDLTDALLVDWHRNSRLVRTVDDENWRSLTEAEYATARRKLDGLRDRVSLR